MLEKMKRQWIGWLLAVAVLMVSCVKPEEVILENVDSFQVKSVSATGMSVDAGLKVTNLSGSKLVLKDAKLILERNGSKMMEIRLTDKVVVPRRSSSVYTLPLVVRFEGLGGLLGIGSVFVSGLKGCTVTVEATLRGGWITKKYRMDDLPADTLLRQAGIDPAEFLQQYQLQ